MKFLLLASVAAVAMTPVWAQPTPASDSAAARTAQPANQTVVSTSQAGSPSSQPNTPSAAPAADPDLNTGTIIVTARRRAEDASKVPIAISAFSGDQLVAKGVQNTIDLVKFTPGLQISGGGSKVNPFIVIRGQSKAVTGNGSPGVITYMNDVPLPGYGSLIQTYDMDNIQVLKGPQGTLFGRNSIGGAVLTNSKLPTYHFGGYLAPEVAQYDFRQIEGAINIPIINEHVALRLAGQINHDGGNVKTYLFSPYTISVGATGVTATPGTLVPSNHNADEYSAKSFRGSLLVEPTDWLKNTTVADYSRIRGLSNTVSFAMYPNGYQGNSPALYYLPPAVIAAALTPSAGPVFANIYAGIVGSLAQCGTQVNCDYRLSQAAIANNVRDRIQYSTEDPWNAVTTIKGIENTTTVRLGDNHQIKNIFGYRSTDSFSNTSLTGTPIPIINTGSQVRLQQTTDEIQASGSLFHNDLKYTAGGFFYNEKPNGLGGYQALETNAFFGLSHQISTTYLHNTSKAVYGQIDYSPSWLISGLNFTAGLRQTWDTQAACTISQAISPFGPQVYLGNKNGEAGVIGTEAACRSSAGLAAGAAGNSLPLNGTSQVFQDAHFKKLTYTIGANYQITPAAMVYLVHRRGYRAGGYNTPAVDPYLTSVQTFQPEVLQDWEIGTKLRFHSGGMRGSFDLALFTGKDTNNQQPVDTSNLSAGTCVPQAIGSGGRTANCSTIASQSAVYAVGTPGVLVPLGGATTTANAATLTIRGIEAAGSFSPVSPVTFTGSFSYTQVKVDSVSLDANFATFLRAANHTVSSAITVQGQPTWTATAGIVLEAPGKILGGHLSGSLDYHYNGSFPQVQITIPSSKQFDARVSLADIADTGLTVSVYAKNLTNETIYQGAGASSPIGIGAGSYILGQPRTIGMQLLYRFGSR